MISSTSGIRLKFLNLHIIPIVILIAIGITNTFVPQTTAQTSYITTQYEQDKAAIETSINQLNDSLESRRAALFDISARKSSLQEEIQTRENNIAELNNSITEARLVEAQLQAQIEENEVKRDELFKQMEDLVPELQKEARKTGIQALIEAENVGELMRRLFGLSSFQVELDTIDKRLEELNLQLAESKKQQEEIRAGLENSVFLLKSEQDGLQILLEQTQGEEAQYQQLIEDLRQQRAQQNAAIEQLEADYQAELAAIAAAQAAAEAAAAAQAAANQNGGGSGSTSGGGSSTPAQPVTPGNCPFEDGSNLGVNLIAPTTGFMSDNFGCPSWTGRWHDGVDIANGIGTPIVAAYGGVVERKGFEGGGFGHYVFLRHYNGSRTFYTLYAHLNVASPLGIGTVVGQGTQVGTMGTTGWSTGPHLHFMVLSDSYNGSLGCVYGSTKCFNPRIYTNF